MKRVLIFSLTYHPYIGGAEVAIKEITDRLSASEFEFHMVSLRFDKDLAPVERIGNITVHRIGPSIIAPRVSDRSLPWQLKLAKVIFPFIALKKALSLHKEYSFDSIWAMMANQAGFAALFFKMMHPEVPYLLELQDGRAFSEMTKRRPILMPLWWLYRRMYLKADRIKVISRFIEKEVRAIGYTGDLQVIPNAVDVAKFSATTSDEELAEHKSRVGKRMGDVFLFTASRLVLSRGVEDTIRALSFLPQNVKLLIAGTGEDQSKLQVIARETGVAERVIFVGHISHDALPMYYKVADIFVRPSIIEGFGNAFVEAFAAGIPVVATPVGGIPDFLFDPETDIDMEPTGIFCKVRDPESIATAVKKYMSNPVLTARIIKNARELVAEQYDWNIIAEQMRKRFFSPIVQV